MPNLIFTRRFSMAHRLLSDKSIKCQNIHGHNIYIKWSVSTRLNFKFDFNENMANSFGELKKRVHEWIDYHVDHSTFLNVRDPLLGWTKENIPNAKVLVFPGDPTTEMIAAAFYNKISCFMQDFSNIELDSVEIEETPTNTVFTTSSFNLVNDKYENYDNWWFNQNDYSTE